MVLWVIESDPLEVWLGTAFELNLMGLVFLFGMKIEDEKGYEK